MKKITRCDNLECGMDDVYCPICDPGGAHIATCTCETCFEEIFGESCLRVMDEAPTQHTMPTIPAPPAMPYLTLDWSDL